MESNRSGPADIDAAVAAEVRRHDHDRYLAALFAADEARPGLLALYAFNLAIARTRETVSEPILGQMRLQWWRDAVAAIYDGGGPRHDTAGALAAAIRRHDLPRAPIEALIDGRERDLDPEPPADVAALERYAEATSANLACLALVVAGDRGAETAEAGRHVGIAWALTGLLRAVPFHARTGRLWLPRDRLDAAGLSAEDVFTNRKPKALGPVVATVAAAARGHLDAARRGLGRMPRSARAVLLPAVLAEAYLGRLAAAGHDPFAGPIEITRLGRLGRLAWAAASGRI